MAGRVDGEIRLAGTMEGPNVFEPGPSAESCEDYDRIWEVSKDDLSLGRPDSRQRVWDWPVYAKAPFVDVDGDRAYDPERGDRPEMLGDQMFWWIMNAAVRPHPQFEIPNLDLDVRVSAFAFDAPGVVGNTTFHRFRIRNTSASIVDSAFAGILFDADLGAVFDDYMGSDSTLGLGYVYNADNDDDMHYGVAPPAIGATLLERPVTSLSNSSSACRYPDEQTIGFTNVHPHMDGYSDIRSLSAVSQYYNVLQSHFPFGYPLTVGEYGTDGSDVQTRFMYSGDPVSGAYWSQMRMTPSLPLRAAPSDRSFFSSLGPFCMAPGEEVELVIAIVWSRGSSNLDSVRQLKEDVAYIQSIRDEILTPRVIPNQNVQEPEVPFAVGVYPNPAGADGVTVRLGIPEALDVGVEVYDALGRRVHAAAGEAIRSAGDHKWTLPTGTWAPGVYLVRIQAGPAVTTRRLVIPN